MCCRVPGAIVSSWFVAVQRGSPFLTHTGFPSSSSLAPLLPDFAASGQTVALFHAAAELLQLRSSTGTTLYVPLLDADP